MELSSPFLDSRVSLCSAALATVRDSLWARCALRRTGGDQAKRIAARGAAEKRP
jgi:hypothetical protein